MNRAIIDTETAGSIEDRKSLRVYDFAYQIVDSDFRVVCSRRFLIAEVFNDAELMSSAYYANKLPLYYRDLAEGSVTCVKLIDAYKQFASDCKQFNVKQAWAYNAAFDRDALNSTISAVSNGFREWFIPYGIKLKCIQSLCASTILKRPTYYKFALANGLVSESGNLRTTAEAAYRYMTNDPAFIESHTALDDVIIERQLLAYALTRKVKGKTSKIKRDAWRLPQRDFKEWLTKD